MPPFVLIALGGAIGALARHLTSTVVQRVWAGEMPMGTFVVNILGCFAIGLFAGASEGRPLMTGEVRLFVVVGVLGGFTTFSSFGFEAFELVRRGFAPLAALHLVWQCVLGVGAVAVGYELLRAR